MTDTYKPLGQAATSDTYSSEGLAYKVPIGSSAAVSSIFITNTNDEDVTYSLSVVPQDETEGTTEQVDFGDDFVVEYATGDLISGKHLKITRVSTGEVSYIDVPGVPTTPAWSRPFPMAANVVGNRLIIAFKGSLGTYSGDANRFNAQYYQTNTIVVASTTDMVEWTVADLSDSHGEFFRSSFSMVTGDPSTLQVNSRVVSVVVFNSGAISILITGNAQNGGTNYTFPSIRALQLDNYASTSYTDMGNVSGMEEGLNTPWGQNYYVLPNNPYYDRSSDTYIAGLGTYGSKAICSVGGAAYYLKDVISTGYSFSNLSYIPGFTFNRARKLANGKLLFSLWSPWGYSQVSYRLYLADGFHVEGNYLIFEFVSYYESNGYLNEAVNNKSITTSNGDDILVYGYNGYLIDSHLYGAVKKIGGFLSLTTFQEVAEIYSSQSIAPSEDAHPAIAYVYFNGEKIVARIDYFDQNNNWWPNGSSRYGISSTVTEGNIGTVGLDLVATSSTIFNSEYLKGLSANSVQNFHYYKIIPTYTSATKNKIITKTISPSSTHSIDGGITLAAGDEVRLHSATNDVVVNVYGAEITGSPMGYKVLGQLYYGPDITQEPEVPGSSSYYASQVITIVDKAFVFTLDPSGYFVTNYSEDNGLTWQSKTHDFDGVLSVAFNEATHTFLVYDIWRTTFRVSNNGLDWTSVTTSLPTSQANVQILSANGLFLASTLGDNPWAAVSADGTSWETVSAPGILFNGYAKYISYSSGEFHIIFGDNTGTGTYLKKSTDGITWTQHALPDGTFDIATNGSSYVATVNNGTSFDVYAAPDLVNANWSIVVPELNSMVSLESVNGKYVIVCNDGGIASNELGKFLLVSEDGFSSYSTVYLPWAFPQDLANVTNVWPIVSVDLTVNKFTLSVYGYNTVDSVNLELFYSSIDGSNWTKEEYPVTGNSNGYSINNRSALKAGIQTITESFTVIGGQGTPGSYVEITEPKILYTVPSDTETVVTSIFVTNNDTVDRTYDLAVVPAGETLAVKHHIRWDMLVTANDIDLISSKLSLSAGDKLYVFPSTVNKVGFTAFGVEKNVL